MSFVIFGYFYCRNLTQIFPLRRYICHFITINDINRIGNHGILFKFFSVADINKYFFPVSFYEPLVNYVSNPYFSKENKFSGRFPTELDIFKNTTLFLEINKAVDNRNFKKIVTAVVYCDENNISPEFKILVLLIDVLSFHGIDDGVVLIRKLSKRLFYDDYCKNCEFEHFNAQIKWGHGNFKEAINKLFYIYESYPSLTDIVSKLFQRLLYVTIRSKGVAVKVIINKLLVDYTIRTNDYSLMATYWFALFQSEWYDDQKEALTILQEHRLQAYIKPFISCFALKLLKYNQLDETYRLMECLLQCQMKSSFRTVILALFEYYYMIGDTKRCSAVWSCCTVMDLNIPHDMIHKYQQILKLDSKDCRSSNSIVKPANLPYKF